MIERREVEIGITSFYATSERAEVVDFSPILDYAEYFILYLPIFLKDILGTNFL